MGITHNVKFHFVRDQFASPRSAFEPGLVAPSDLVRSGLAQIEVLSQVGIRHSSKLAMVKQHRIPFHWQRVLEVHGGTMVWYVVSIGTYHLEPRYVERLSCLTHKYLDPILPLPKTQVGP